MEQTTKLGTDKLKTIVLAVVALGVATSLALEDGFQASKDIVALTPQLFTLPGILTKENIAGAKAQFEDLDPEERKNIVNEVESKFDLPNDSTEEKIESAFNLVMAADRTRVAFSTKKA